MQIYPIFTVPKTDMESGSGDPWIPTGWSGYVAQAGELVQWSADYVIGPHSLKLNNLDGGQATGIQNPVFPVTAGKTYRLKFWTKWTGEEAGKLRYLMKNGNGTLNMNGGLFALTTTSYTDWKMVTRDFLCTIGGPSGRVRFRGNASPTTWLIDQISLVELTSDSYYTPDPTEQLSVGSDFFMSSRGGDVWHRSIDESKRDTDWDILNTNFQSTVWYILNENKQDVAWDILNAFALNLAWDILNGNDQDIAWSIFAKVLYFIQQFFVKQICFDFNIKEPVNFVRAIKDPLQFTYGTTEVLKDTIHLIKTPSFDTIKISSPIKYTFQIKEPITFTFPVDTITSGFRDTENLG
jgi:hypothetical protein